MTVDHSKFCLIHFAKTFSGDDVCTTFCPRDLFTPCLQGRIFNLKRMRYPWWHWVRSPTSISSDNLMVNDYSFLLKYCTVHCDSVGSLSIYCMRTGIYKAHNFILFFQQYISSASLDAIVKNNHLILPL